MSPRHESELARGTRESVATIAARAQAQHRAAVETWGLGKLVSEMGEAGQSAGNSLCFGLDTPERDGATGRTLLSMEIGDVLAVYDWMVLAGIVDPVIAAAQRQKKLAKFLDPKERTNDGRPLAPVIFPRFG